jgi:hypothetical protein
MYIHIATSIVKVLKDSSSYIVNRMDTNQEITSRLKFIGQLKKGDKINTRHMFVQPNGYGTSISRTFLYQDNRGNGLNFCQETITRAFELLVTYERSDKSSESNVLFQNLINDLQHASDGLKNLKATYVTDTKFCCDMDTLIETTQARLETFITKKNSENQNAGPIPIQQIHNKNSPKNSYNQSPNKNDVNDSSYNTSLGSEYSPD